MEIRQFDLKALLKEVCNEFEQVAVNKEIKIKKNISNESFLMTSDPEMLQRVFENLLSNAIKYSNPNSEIEISLQNIGNQRLIKFKDQGIGIKEDELEGLFEEYGTTSATPTSGETSTGLGTKHYKKNS